MRSIWHNMPRRSFLVLLAAVFMTFLPIGSLADVYNLGAYSPARLLAVVAFAGFIAVGFVYSIRIDRRYLPLVIALQIAFLLQPNRTPFTPRPAAAVDSAIHARMTFDALASGASIIVAYPAS